MENQKMDELIGKDIVIGYVYDYDGNRKAYYFENTPSNIASFIMLHKENTDKMILTDIADRLVLNTFGEFINQCPDQKLLQEILKDLLPMQMGEKDTVEFLIVDEAEYQDFLDKEER